MAALVLSIAGAAAGSAVLGPVGAIVGRLVGAVAGNVIDQALFGARRNLSLEGPRLNDLTVMASTEGAPIARVYALLNVRFSNRPVGVKRFQTIHHCSVDVAHGLALIFGIGTKALPSWDSRTRWNNLWVGFAVSVSTNRHAQTPKTRSAHSSFGLATTQNVKECEARLLGLFEPSIKIGR